MPHGLVLMTDPGKQIHFPSIFHKSAAFFLFRKQCQSKRESEKKDEKERCAYKVGINYITLYSHMKYSKTGDLYSEAAAYLQ